jgi:hypothetical protein
MLHLAVGIFFYLLVWALLQVAFALFLTEKRHRAATSVERGLRTSWWVLAAVNLVFLDPLIRFALVAFMPPPSMAQADVVEEYGVAVAGLIAGVLVACAGLANCYVLWRTAGGRVGRWIASLQASVLVVALLIGAWGHHRYIRHITAETGQVFALG